jgi:prolyl-tRNA synthetase
MSKAESENNVEIGLTVKKSQNLSEWYQQVILKSKMADYSPVGGCMIFLPWSFSIWEKIREWLDAKLQRLGHENAYFPLFIPESLLKRESEHFAGFTPEVAWVQAEGDASEERLAIRPTSETIMYHMYSKWIRSYRDLPLLLNQWNNVVRWEFKSTRLFLRTREFLWQEGHTAHASKEEADTEVRTILGIYQELARDLLALPSLAGLKSEGEKFAGALYTTTFEMLMPDGRALQAGTSHGLGQNFAKAFDIQYLTKEQRKEYVWQTSWGISTRLIGALVMVHGDDRGLVLPPAVAPIQIIIVPIYYSPERSKEVTEYSLKVFQKLNKSFRIKIDDREDKTPGWKYNEWELKGVPLRLEVGPRDIEKQQVIFVRRDTNDKKEKQAVAFQDIEKRAKSVLGDIQSKLLKKAEDFLRAETRGASSYEEFRRIIAQNAGFVVCSWCGEVECEREISSDTGATVRLIPFEDSAPTTETCFHCNRRATKLAYFARSY